MNAAFVLMTTAWLATGDHHAASSSCGPACNTATTSCCDSGCNSFGHNLRDKLRGLFQRNSCNSCDTCAPAPVKHHHCAAPKACAPATCATACDPCESQGHKLLGRLRGMFNRGGDCCEASCGASSCANGSCGSTAPGPVTTPGGPAYPHSEPIAPPKKMPSTKEPPAGKQVRDINNAPAPILQQSSNSVPVFQDAPIPEILIPVTGNVIRIE